RREAGCKPRTLLPYQGIGGQHREGWPIFHWYRCHGKGVLPTPIRRISGRRSQDPPDLSQGRTAHLPVRGSHTKTVEICLAWENGIHTARTNGTGHNRPVAP